MPYYPVFLDIKGRPCLVIGGGNVAERKVSALISAGANWKNTDVEIADNIITAANPDASRRFGAAILNMLRRQTQK
jgi:siroheme synthase (precorrin-2 oxidase/ferrochelatase)